jgi:hypothetical protein
MTYRLSSFVLREPSVLPRAALAFPPLLLVSHVSLRPSFHPILELEHLHFPNHFHYLESLLVALQLLLSLDSFVDLEPAVLVDWHSAGCCFSFL